MTQLDLATKMNRSRSHISKWENELNIPGMATVERIARAFGMEPYDLIQGADHAELIYLFGKLAAGEQVKVVEYVDRTYGSSGEIMR